MPHPSVAPVDEHRDPRPAERNHALDSAKFFVVGLVVLGHLLAPLIHDSRPIRAVWMVIYSFHMPLFAMVAGMVTTTHRSPAAIAKLVRGTALPLLVFTVLYETFTRVLTGQWSPYSVGLQPYWILWFLHSLFLWRLALPALLVIRQPLWVSMAFGVGAGYILPIGYFLGVARTLYFLPFFLAGYALGPNGIARMRRSRAQRVAALLVITTTVGLCATLQHLPHKWLYGSVSYAALGSPEWHAGGIRLGIYVTAFLTATAVLLLAPTGTSSIAKRGANSLYVYVWHGFIVNALIASGFVAQVGTLPPIIALGTLALTAAAITLVLSTAPVAHQTQRFLLRPTARLLLREPPTTAR